MASITVRDIPDATKENLRIHAAQHGQSLEAYVRHILLEVSRKDVPDRGTILEIAGQYFGEGQGIDLALPERRSTRHTVTFDS